jgi:hypothetical protein
MTDIECQTETGYGQCILGTTADGGPSGYAKGYCTADCTMAAENDAWCQGAGADGTADGGAYCVPYFATDQNGSPLYEWYCVPGCQPSTAFADAGSNCRSGYECAANLFWNDPAGDVKTCEPDCTAASDCAAQGGCLTSFGCYNITCDMTSKACQ